MSKYQPGQSGNPGGRPKKDAWLTELAQAYGPEALDILVQQMRSDNPMIAQKAAALLIERGFGKARQSVEMTGADGEALLSGITVKLVKPE